MKQTLSLPGTPPRVSEVFIDADLMRSLPRDLAPYLGERTAYWIWDEHVWRLWQERVVSWGWPDLESRRVILFAASESNKRLSAVEELAQRLIRLDADRQSALVAVGGGVTGDVVGFLASIYMRGIPHFQVPTTLLAQVDSSIGGKTGVDLPEGKNLLGSFYQARAIWMDPHVLTTLSADAFRQGMAEVIKSAMIGDEVLWKYLESHSSALQQRQSEALMRVVAACCLLKARVVEADEKESGLRRVLNLGHTVGHALERVSNYRIPHGDAVALGMVAATKLAVRLGRVEEEVLIRLEQLCKIWQLPVRLSRSYPPAALITALRTDKKWLGDTLHFILPVGIGEVIDYDGLKMSQLEETLEALQEE